MRSLGEMPDASASSSSSARYSPSVRAPSREDFAKTLSSEPLFEDQGEAHSMHLDRKTKPTEANAISSSTELSSSLGQGKQCPLRIKDPKGIFQCASCLLNGVRKVREMNQTEYAAKLLANLLSLLPQELVASRGLKAYGEEALLDLDALSPQQRETEMKKTRRESRIRMMVLPIKRRKRGLLKK